MRNQMNTNTNTREKLVVLADDAFALLARQLDLLFAQVIFYIERYPGTTLSNTMKLRELNNTIVELGHLAGLLSRTIIEWKLGSSRSNSSVDIEMNVLCELRVNVQALIYFLASHEISLEPFDQDLSDQAFSVLMRTNRLL